MPTFSAKLRRRQLDELLKGVEITLPKRGYIREVRDALEMSSYQLAERMGLSQSTIKQFEENERCKAITLKSLERAADALGCRVVYAFVPKTSLTEFVAQQARKQAVEISTSVERTMGLELQSSEASDAQEMLAEVAEEILRKGGRELWRSNTVSINGAAINQS